MRIQDFDYHLPPELVAQHPAAERAASRLLHLDGGSGAIEDRTFRDIVDLVDARDVVIFNDTKVIKARLRGRKDTGGEVEILVERILDAARALAHVRASKPPRAGRQIRLARGGIVEVLGRQGELFELLYAWGEVPLPPYIEHVPQAEDEERYQTVYARAPGAVAAPTAGLHFDAPLLDALRAKGVALATLTLHVGAGTFQPVRVEDVASHVMHSEWYSVSAETVAAVRAAKARGGRVIAVGTTSLRALESAAA